MSTFVNKYDNLVGTTFSRILKVGSNATYVVGSRDGKILFSKFDDSGNVLFCKEIAQSSSSDPIGGVSGVECNNGDFMVLGTMNTGSTSARYVLIRVSSSGSVIWCKEVYTSGTRIIRDIVKSGTDSYIIAAWYLYSGSTRDHIEVIKVNGSGAFQAVNRIELSTDTQPNHLIPWGNGGAMVIGGSIGQGAFYSEFDSNLSCLSARTFMEGSTYREARQVIACTPPPGVNSAILIAGESNSSAQTFVTMVDPVSHNILASVRVDAISGTELVVRSIHEVNGNFYVIVSNGNPYYNAVIKLTSSLGLVWVKEISPNNEFYISDIKSASGSPTELILSGRHLEANSDIWGVLLRTDEDLDSCLTNSKTFTAISDSPTLTSRSPRVQLTATPTINNLTYSVTNRTPSALDMCCPGSLGLDSSVQFQSPYLYMQGSGSDGSDGSVKGYHLRWDLMKELGEEHLPKGDLTVAGGPYPTTIAYNRPNDYVYIYKAQHTGAYRFTLSTSTPPSSLVETGTERSWTYAGFQPIAGLPSQTTDVVFTFKDITQYDIIRGTINPLSNPQAFLQAYGGEVEMRCANKLMFYIRVDLGFTSPSTSSSYKMETVSIRDRNDTDSRWISLRQDHTLISSPEDIYCENMEMLRFSCNNAYPNRITLETYEDFVVGAENACEWSQIGQYSLDDGQSDSSAEVFRRLEDSPNFQVDRQWPKYNDTSASEFRVRVENYQDRWLYANDGLQQAVIDYLDASRTDTQAVITLSNNDPNTNQSAMDVSYLNMLNFVSIDYHVARMLGLGHIEPAPTATTQDRYVFLAEYVTEAQLPGMPAGTLRHFHASIPVNTLSTMFAPVPEMDCPPVYGLWVDNGTGTPTYLTDSDGYSYYEDLRFVNLYRQKSDFERDMETFFQINDEIDLSNASPTTLFGIDYRENGGSYVKPEINHDPDYLDYAGLAETMGVPNTGDLRVYTHEETNNGVHLYALYGVNWFSRPSQRSTECATDNTQFPKRSKLLPPSNFTTTLIQKETPRLFTTAAEQTMLDNISGSDKTLVRAVFDWNQVQNNAYQYPDKVEFFYRIDPPAVIKGKIQVGAGAVVPNSANHTVTIQTTSFTITSTNPAQTITPVISSGDVSKYIGSRLVANGVDFIIDAIVTPGTNPVIRLKQLRQTQSVDLNNNGQFTTTEFWLDPEEGAQFFIVENLDDTAAWDVQLVKEVALQHWSPTYTETVNYPDGTSKIFQIGGLTDTGTINDVWDPDPNIGSFVPTGGPANVPTGVYTLEFDTYNLASHSDPDVDFFQGTVRVRDDNGDMKELKVWEIDNSGTTLKLTAYDPTFGLERDPNTGMFILTSLQFTPVSGYVPVDTGSAKLVNFHPSYRVYLYAEASAFADTNILPGSGQGNRITFMGVRSKDTTQSPVCYSYLATPAPLLAREIRIPVPPGVPIGGAFATRPNFYGKSTYTFDMEVDDPYALIVYRASNRRILDQLYKPATVQDILDQLERLADYDARFNNNRWSDLVNMVTDANDEFVQHTEDGFRFPIPDNDEYVIPNPDPNVIVKPFVSNTTPPGSGSTVSGTSQSMAEVVKDAIDGAFLPMTENPLIFAQVTQDQEQTSGKAPKLRNANGDKLVFGDAEYDPWPMALRYEQDPSGNFLIQGDSGYGNAANSKFVRFTDFTLAGAGNNQYFYFGVELSNTLAVSDRSPVAGPISLLNSQPARQPEIKGINVQLKDIQAGLDYRIDFTITAYNRGDRIKYFDLYRTTDPDAAASVRFMDKVGSFFNGDPIQDTFADLEYIPFGEGLYYRIIAYREIMNEEGEMELIPSLPSRTAMTTIIDMDNPVAPELTFISDPLHPTNLEYTNGKIRWEKVAHNSTYTLFKMDEQGTWVKIWSQATNADEIEVDLATSGLGTGTFQKVDDEGNTLYHRFRVDVVNSSGLVNTKKNELTI